MTPEAQINFYLSERVPGKFVIINKHGDKIEKQIYGFHFQFIAWQRIAQLYHPRKFPLVGHLRSLAGKLCRYAIEYWLSKTIKENEAYELKKAYKSVIDACPF